MGTREAILLEEVEAARRESWMDLGRAASRKSAKMWGLVSICEANSKLKSSLDAMLMEMVTTCPRMLLQRQRRGNGDEQRNNNSGGEAELKLQSWNSGTGNNGFE